MKCPGFRRTTGSGSLSAELGLVGEPRQSPVWWGCAGTFSPSLAVPSSRLAESQLSAQFHVPEQCFRTAQSQASPPSAGAGPRFPEHGPVFQECSPGEPNAAPKFVSRVAKIQLFLQESFLPGHPGSEDSGTQVLGEIRSRCIFHGRRG